MAAETQKFPQTLSVQRSWLTCKRLRGWTRSILTHAALIPAAVIFLLPFLWMVSTSLKTDEQLFVYPPIWIPHPIAWWN